jgi:predicted RNA binding protein YcfA (HicA-like mRNA interferase family)
MSDFPALTGQRLIKALGALGFVDTRQKGSHHFLALLLFE